VSRGPPRAWKQLLRAHVGRPIVFRDLHAWDSYGLTWLKVDAGLCYVTRVIGDHFESSTFYNEKNSFTEGGAGQLDIVIEAISNLGLIQVRTSHFLTSLLDEDGNVIWAAGRRAPIE